MKERSKTDLCQQQQQQQEVAVSYPLTHFQSTVGKSYDFLTPLTPLAEKTFVLTHDFPFFLGKSVTSCDLSV